MLILKNATVVEFNSNTGEGNIEEGIDIVIEGSTITGAGRGLSGKYKDSGAEEIDLTGKIAMPGFVCSHNHFYSALSRGITANIEPSTDFVSVLKHLWWRLDRALDEESVYYSGLAGALDAVRSGTTSVIDHHASPSFIKGSLNLIKEGFKKTGLRGILAYEVTDRNGESGMRDGVSENREFAEQNADNPLIKGAVGAHAPFTLGDKAMSMLSGAVKDTGAGLHIHVCEDSYDASNSHHLYGMDVTERLEKFHLLDEKTILVHGVYLTDSDRERINDYNAFLVHNARSNMNNGVGYNSKLPDLKNVALGTDGIGSDMIEEMKIAYFKHKDTGGSLWPPDFLRFLSNGNKLLERYFGEHFGLIEKGYKADITVLDYDPPTPLNKDNIAGHFVFGLSSEYVETVIIGGKVVYKDRKFPFDVSEIYKKARDVSKKLWERMDKIK